MKTKLAIMIAALLCVVGTMDASAQLSGPGSRKRISPTREEKTLVQASWVLKRPDKYPASTVSWARMTMAEARGDTESADRYRSQMQHEQLMEEIASQRFSAQREINDLKFEIERNRVESNRNR